MDKKLLYLICGCAFLVTLYSFSPEWGEGAAALTLVLLLINRSRELKELVS